MSNYYMLCDIKAAMLEIIKSSSSKDSSKVVVLHHTFHSTTRPIHWREIISK